MATEILRGVRCVLLDIDGTLVDSNEFHVKAWNQAFQRSGHTVGVIAIRKQIGKGADQLIPALLPHATAAKSEAIANAHDKIFRARYLSKVRAFDGARDFVVCLHSKGVKVVLASSAKRAEVEHYIQLLDIEKLLEASTSADDVEHSKPAGDIFAAALGKIDQATSAQALVVGDTPYDVVAATKCGVATIAVLSGGFSASTLRLAGAREVYSSVSELLAAIES